jgi:hypothetical protein
MVTRFASFGKLKKPLRCTHLDINGSLTQRAARRAVAVFVLSVLTLHMHVTIQVLAKAFIMKPSLFEQLNKPLGSVASATLLL